MQTASKAARKTNSTHIYSKVSLFLSEMPNSIAALRLRVMCFFAVFRIYCKEESHAELGER